MSDLPLVSCIMPTANRQKFIPFAIQYFQRQDYPNAELIILDDGLESIEQIIPTDPKIKYTRVNQKQALVGAKRNQACSLATGEIIMHWDDDDWYASDWISWQMKVLNATKADICGLSQLFFYDPAIRKSWKYIYPANERPWVGGATMAYSKAFWQTHPFRDMQVGEDNQFVWFSGAKVAAHQYFGGFVSILHPGNTSPKHINNSRWVPCDVNGINAILKNDFLSY
jgi:glycosyltransferase involved in cell wall biosynthesis